jgi:hypothetical protein
MTDVEGFRFLVRRPAGLASAAFLNQLNRNGVALSAAEPVGPELRLVIWVVTLGIIPLVGLAVLRLGRATVSFATRAAL